MYAIVSRTNADYSALTRGKLIRVATRLFGRDGFGAVSSERIVKAAGLTRGALYHHFDGKEGLFAAVLEEQMRELHRRLAVTGRGARSPLSGLRKGIRAYFEACTSPAFRQVVLLDGPAVVGWGRWRALDLTLGLGLLKQGLEAAVAGGELTRQPTDVLAHLVAGALIDGAMVVARDRRKARRVESALWSLLLHGLTPRGARKTATRRPGPRRTR
jgi:AcrR family transcriptional regulator